MVTRSSSLPASPTPSAVLDLTRDLAELARQSTSAVEIDELLGQALDALGRLIPFDLATILELDRDALALRVARGRLAGAQVQRHRLPLDRFPSIRAALECGRARAFREEDHRDGDGDPFDGVLDLPHGHSCMVVPLGSGRDALGILTFDRAECQTYPDAVVELAEVFASALALALRYGRQSELLERLRAQVSEQNRLLAERATSPTDPRQMLAACRSASMRELVRVAREVAVSDAPVLITGETGTGKEVVAGAIHRWSARAGEALVSINCAALPESLIESELFGHVKGAFTGATSARMGRFQAANGGTLFLDEVAELSPALQAKLLRAVQEGCFEPVGSDRTVRVDVRVIAATNVDLRAAVAEKRFREDLYWRLAVFPLHVPPLRARPEDIEPIAEAYLGERAARGGRTPWQITSQALAALQARAWPGNVRELLNALERAALLSRGVELSIEAGDSLAPPAAPDVVPAVTPLREAERAHIERALANTGGRLWGPAGAAALLGMKPSTLASRMKKLGIAPPRARHARASAHGA